MEVANFCAAMDTFIDQDAENITSSSKEVMKWHSVVSEGYYVFGAMLFSLYIILATKLLYCFLSCEQ